MSAENAQSVLDRYDATILALPKSHREGMIEANAAMKEVTLQAFESVLEESAELKMNLLVAEALVKELRKRPPVE
jgi:hypothetical protein